MGLFKTSLKIWNPEKSGRVKQIRLLVDTRAGYSRVSRKQLEMLGIQPTRRMQFKTIEGRIIERDLAPVFVRFDGRSGGDTVVIAEPGDVQVLGAHTLESLGLAVDPVRRKLIPTIGLAMTIRGAR